MTHEQLHAYLTLAMTPYIGPKSFAGLLRHFGDAHTAISAGILAMSPYLERGEKAIQALKEQKAEAHVQAALKWVEQDNCQLITLMDKDYPMDLAQGIAPPPVLFLRGRRDLLKSYKLTMVGSRKATSPSLKIAYDWAKQLSESGICVVSGLASGIDTAVHQGALEGSGSTIAVLGTGIDRIYPASNRRLTHQIAQEGLLISEFALGTQATPHNFPRRNRIIAALGQATIVVEASQRSGSLSTARLAGEMGRDVMAVPHTVYNLQGRGCHSLIKQGAKLVECVSDILDECTDWVSHTKSNTKSIQSANTSSLPTENHEQDDLLCAMAFDAVYPDELADRLAMDVADVYARLLVLELDGIVSLCPGGRYQRVKNY